MSGIPLPALAIQPPHMQNPLEAYAQVQSIQGAQQERQLRQQQIQQAEQANQMQAQKVKDQKIVTDLYVKNNGNLDQTIADAAKAGVTPETLQALQLHSIDVKGKTLDLVTKQGAQAIQQGNLIQGAKDELAKADPKDRPALWPQKLQALKAAGIDTDAAGLPAEYPGDDQFKVIGALVQGHTQQLEEAAKQAGIKKDEAQTGEANAIGEQKRQESEYYRTHGGAPGVSAEIQQQNAWLSRPENKGKDAADYKAWAAKQAPLATFNLQSGLLTDQAKDMAAENYYQTGQLPSGARSPAIISQIINRAGELHPGGNLAGNKAAYEANKISYDNVTSTLDTLTAFENTGLKNLKQFTDLAAKIPDTGVPWLNTPVRNLSDRLVGSENMAAVNAARSVALREIARVTNDPKLKGSLTDTARKEVEDLSPSGATFNQIKAVATILQQDMANVHQGLAQQKLDIGWRLGLAQNPMQPATTPQAGPPKGATMKVPGSDGKLHWSDGKQDLGVAE